MSQLFTHLHWADPKAKPEENGALSKWEGDVGRETQDLGLGTWERGTRGRGNSRTRDAKTLVFGDAVTQGRAGTR